MLERIKQIVLQTKSDVITFQEMDHAQQFLKDKELSANYTCMVNSSKAYKPPTYTRQKGSSHYNDLSPDKYFHHILKSCATFAPKSYSNVYLFRSKQDGKATDIDDDGCVIFWKKRHTQTNQTWISQDSLQHWEKQSCGCAHTAKSQNRHHAQYTHHSFTFWWQA